MDRTDSFEKSKIFKAATNKVITNVYCDSFPIEKVKFQNACFADKKSIFCYVDFSVIARMAADLTTGRFFKVIEEDKYHRYTVSLGGSKKDGKIISRRMFVAVSGDKVFINMEQGPGKENETGAIIPAGEAEKIGVPMDKDTFREMILYTHDWITAYLGPMVHKLVKEVQEERKSAS